MPEGDLVQHADPRWIMNRRTGLRSHDNQPVLARDCVASLRRRMRRDAPGANRRPNRWNRPGRVPPAAEQPRLERACQLPAFETLPFSPPGRSLQSPAGRHNLQDILRGSCTTFRNTHKTRGNAP
jgi:hypothetical protein